MSFGIGIGDFIAVFQLATKIRKDFAGGPADYKALAQEVKTLSILIQDVEVEADTMEPATAEKVRIAMAASTAILTELDAFIEKHKAVADKRSGSKVKRFWQKLSIDPQEIARFRSQITSNVSILRGFTEKNLRDTVNRIDERVESQESREMRKLILDWISPEEWKHHQDVQKGLVRRLDGQPATRQWLFESSGWYDWIRSPGSMLYCPGIPGAGKTITTSLVIDKLQKEFPDSMAVAYIFCEYQRKNKEAFVFVQSALRMLLQQLPKLPAKVKPLYERDQERAIDFDDVHDLLKTLSLQRRLVIVADALDELLPEVRKNLILQLGKFQRGTSLSLFCTSRKMPDIRDLLLEAGSELFSVEVTAAEEDVASFLDHNITSLPKCILNDKTLRSEVRETIIQTTQGMFLLAQLRLNSLKTMRRPRSVREELRGFSQSKASYQEAYEAAMKRIEAQGHDDREMAHRAILVAAFARRMLTASEFCHAVSVDTQEALDLAEVATLEDILSTCAGLVSYQQEANQIQLVHQSTEEYFRDTESKWFPDGEAIMRDICDTYNEACEEEGTAHLPHEKQSGYPFLAYSALYYASHRVRAEEGIIKDVLPQDQNHLDTHQETTRAAKSSGLRRFGQEFADLDIVLESAIEHGKYVVVEFMLQMNPKLRGARLNEPLRVAVEHGDKDRVSLLLGNKAEILVPDRRLSLLSIAAREGHLEIMEHLLYWDSAAVHSMLYCGNGLRIIESDETRYDSTNVSTEVPPDRYAITLADLSDYNPESRHSAMSSLSLAAKRGHLECVRFLLELISKDVNTDAATIFGERIRALASALVCYTPRGKFPDHHCEPADVLFQEFAPPNPKIECEITSALTRRQNWCRQGRTNCANLILDDILFAEPTSTSAMISILVVSQLALWNGMPAIAQRMDRLKFENVFRNTMHQYGLTTLHFVAGYGCSRALRQFLKQHNVDLNQRDDYGRTALMYATQGGHLESMEIILNEQALDVNARDQDGIGAIHCAARKGGSVVIEALLKRSDLDLNKQDNDGNTALHHIAGRKNLKLELLLSRKIPRDSSDMNGLDCHKGKDTTDVELNEELRKAENTNFDITSLLIKQPKTIIGLTNKEGRTPIHQAVDSMNNGSLSALLLSGRKVGINRKTPQGWTPLMSAIAPFLDLRKIPEMVDYRLKLVNTLLENWALVMGEKPEESANWPILVNEKDEQGEAALHKAVRRLVPSLVSRLLLCSDLSTDAQDQHGYTPLHAAVMVAGGESALAIVQRLVDKSGELTSIRDNSGRTPLALLLRLAESRLKSVYRSAKRQEDDENDSKDAGKGVCFTFSFIKTAIYLHSKTNIQTDQGSSRRQAERFLRFLDGWDAITNFSEALQEPVAAAVGIMQAILLAPKLRQEGHVTLDDDHTVLQDEVLEGYRGWIFEFSAGVWHEVRRTTSPKVSVPQPGP